MAGIRKIPGYIKGAPVIGERFPFYVMGKDVPFQTGRVKHFKIQIIDEDNDHYEIIQNSDNGQLETSRLAIGGPDSKTITRPDSRSRE